MGQIVKDDEVVVIAGNHKGLTGKVLRVDGSKILIQGVNVRKKHMKPTQENPKGQILQIERPINISNVKPYVDGKAVKLRVKSEKDGAKVVYYKDGKKDVVHRTLKKAK